MVALPTVKLESFSGTHYEIGVQQGQAVGGLIHQLLRLIPNLESVKRMKPNLLPTSLFLALAKRRANKLLRNDIFQYYPKQAQRIRGLAEGTGINIPTVLFIQSMEMLLFSPTESNYRLQACTSLGFTPQRTTTAETIVAKNFDYVNELAPFHLTCQSNPIERYKTLGCTMAPLPGMLDGMNEHGLTVTYNLAYTTDKPKLFAPLSLALQEMLETCKNTDEAVEFITQAKQGGHDALLMIADAEGNVKAVEITPNHSATRESVDGQIINTNHCHTKEMQQYEIPHNAVWVSGVPESLIGARVHESSLQRMTRAQGLLENMEKIDENSIVTILRDHGEDNKPSSLTI
ncbi:MAG: C45 family autoproteolytic acyltransferase/hydrolase, partial [Candidatus Bathyarchaeia archaeon]